MPGSNSSRFGLLAVASLLTMACGLQVVASRHPLAASGHPAERATDSAIAAEEARPPHFELVEPTPPIAGKGMWLYEFDRVAGGDPAMIVREAVRNRISHIFVRAGSGYSGNEWLPQARSLLLVAHAAGVKVIPWYFPYFNNIPADVRRCLQVLHTTVEGESFDGLALDIEPTGGSALSWTTARVFSETLRKQAPDSYLIIVPPRPTPTTMKSFPYRVSIPYYDAVAPMVYWGRYDPAKTVAFTITYLSQFGKPVAPIGQAYDMGPEGGPRGNPPPHETWAFMKTAQRLGAPGVSFWDWQEASSPEFNAIRKYPW